MITQMRDIRCDKCNKPISCIVSTIFTRIFLCDDHAGIFKKLNKADKKAFMENCF